MSKFKEQLRIIEEALITYGHGWFFNMDNNRLVKIPNDGIGPNGDHDGWLTLTDNAKQLGIDEKKAKDFQESIYGILIDSTNPLYKELKRLQKSSSEIKDATCNPTPTSIYVTTSQSDYDTSPELKSFLDKYFMKNYGHPFEGYPDIQFPELLRIRLWPNGELKITRQFGVIDEDVVDAILKIQDKLGDDLAKVKTIDIGNEDESYVMNFNDFMSLHNLSDLYKHNRYNAYAQHG